MVIFLGLWKGKRKRAHVCTFLCSQAKLPPCLKTFGSCSLIFALAQHWGLPYLKVSVTSYSVKSPLKVVLETESSIDSHRLLPQGSDMVYANQNAYFPTTLQTRENETSFRQYLRKYSSNWKLASDIRRKTPISHNRFQKSQQDNRNAPTITTTKRCIAPKS